MLLLGHRWAKGSSSSPGPGSHGLPHRTNGAAGGQHQPQAPCTSPGTVGGAEDQALLGEAGPGTVPWLGRAVGTGTGQGQAGRSLRALGHRQGEGRL